MEKQPRASDAFDGFLCKSVLMVLSALALVHSLEDCRLQAQIDRIETQINTKAVSK